MNEQVAKLLGYIAIALALIGIGAASAWEWQANAYGKVIATNEANRQADLTLIANAGAAQARQAVSSQQQSEQALAALDSKATKEKADALDQNETLRVQLAGTQSDNNRLRSDVVAGDRRLRIAGRCPAADTASGNVSAPASAASLGDATSVELSAAAGQTVFDIRAGIIADQAALKALQEYATNVCQAGNAR